MDQQYPTVAKIPILDTRKLEQWQFLIQQYLQHEHYALWEVIEFGDSYEVPTNTTDTTTTTTTTTTTSGETETNKHKTARELWAVILKTFGGNEATKKTKKNLLKQQYGNFRAEGSETLEQMFSRLQVIVGQLQFMDVEVEQDDLNTNVPTASASVATISQDTACAYIASQSSGSQIKFEDINQIDEDDIKEMDITWNMTLLSMRADKFWKRAGNKISNQGSDVAGFDTSKVECFNCHKMGHFARECRAPRSQDRGRRDNFRQGSKAEEQAPKALMAIDRVGWDWSYMANNREDHALVADEEAPTEFELMANTSTESKTGLPECADDTVTDYSRPSPTVESTLEEDQNRNPSVTENVASPITPKPFIKFVKPKDSQSESKTYKKETPKKPPVKYAEQYRKPNKKPNNKGEKEFHTQTCSSQTLQTLIKTSENKYEWLRSPYRPPCVPTVNKYFPPANRNFSTGSRNFPTANRKFSTASRKFPTGSTKSPTADIGMKGKAVKTSACWSWKPSKNLSNKGNISYLSDYEPFNGGYVSFGQGGCKITGKGTIKTGKLEFKNVYFVKDLKTPRQHKMYSIDLNNIVPHRDLICLVAKASTDECMLWHRRLRHLNFKTMNKLVRHNLVRGLPTKCFENDHTCTAFLKGKQHKAS
nr:hypothetical protein [Tanacetum cinerariifolium]